MGKAGQLMQYLGHMSIKANISIINSKTRSCLSAASYGRHKDADKGPSFAGLLGKTIKRESVSP
jgi:hypothetical protein